MNKNSLLQHILTNLQSNSESKRDSDDPAEFEWTNPLEDVEKIQTWKTEEKMER
jgi:hypothetical protein